MLLLKLFLKSAFEHVNHSQTSWRIFRTTYLRKTSKKFNFRKNNFNFRTDFQSVKESQTESIVKQQPTVLDTKAPKIHPGTRAPKCNETLKSEIHQLVKSSSTQSKKNSSRNKKKLSTLQYKGEILYGIHPVYLALLQKKRSIFQLFLRTSNEESIANSNMMRKDEIEAMAKAQGIAVCHVHSKDMKYLAPGWQEADCQNETRESAKHFPIWLVLNELLDPMNVGAIIRSAYYFGISEVFVVKDNGCKLSPTVSKASSGALEVVNMFHIESLPNVIKIKKMKGWNIISTVAYCEENSSPSLPVVDVTELKVNKPTILLLGNEGKGISSEIQNLCDTFVSIPPAKALHQGIDSLNVSVAAGVILYALSIKRQTY
ncbi:hypothetical protein JTE90_002533 [Oedothorax gibbosus]|uniref:tRNA/rRNA methyltransferase SpoU type domain-containing protein n=1 Tax=Oedothorax gibbosus TaxID=931172 RepID=A0AAV6V368_9ARAC|nr:hypothetical protein JTE90_002533 [Oedothorax gibbosus]